MKQEPACDDPYEILGVAADATADDIRTAHRRLVLRFHPDVNRDDPAAAKRFDAVQQAYRLLSDLERRRRWDERRRASAGRPAPGSDGRRHSQDPEPSPPPAAATGEAARTSSREKQAPPVSTHENRANEGGGDPTTDEDVVDFDLPIDEFWDTSGPTPARTAGVWRKRWSLERWIPRSPRAIVHLVVVGVGLAGTGMMAMQVMPAVGAIVLIAAPVALYAVDRAGLLG